MKNLNLKKMILVIFVLLFIITITACDTVSDNFGSTSSREYDTDIEIEIDGEIGLSEYDLEGLANQFRVSPTDAILELNSLETNEEDNKTIIHGKLRELVGENTVSISHDFYGNNSRNITPSTSSTSFYLEVSLGEGEDGFVSYDVSVDKKMSADNTEFYSLKFLEDFNSIQKIGIKNDEYGGDRIKYLDEIIFASASNGLTVADLLLLDGSDNILARVNDIEINEDLEEIEFSTDITRDKFETSSGVATQSMRPSVDYLASYEIEISDGDFEEEWLDLNLSSRQSSNLPDQFLVINNIAIDFNFDYDNTDDSFYDIFDREHRNSGSVEEMALYYKLGDEMRDAADQQPIGEGDQQDVESAITRLYVNTGNGNPPYYRAAASITFEHTPKYQDGDNQEVHLYEITIHSEGEALAGLPAARRFTAFSPDYDRTASLDATLEVTSDNELEELPIYILGLGDDQIEGSGDSDDPFKIYNADQLNEIMRYNETNPDYHYELVNDIDMSEYEDWQPIGDDTRHFQGQFNGNGHEIKYLQLTREDIAGLFGVIGENARVRNFKIRDFDITGDRYVGSVAGKNRGVIEDIEMTETNSINGYDQYVGGLIGLNEITGTIKNSISLVDISSEAEIVGGIAGANINGASIEDVSSYANVTGIEQVGGLVGLNDSQGIKDSEAFGDITGERRIGGLAGINRGSIDNSDFIDGSVISDGNETGGIAGVNENLPYGEISNSTVRSASISGYNTIGGIAGINRADIVDTIAIDETTVSGEDNNVGGLVGHNRHEGLVATSEFRGDVSGRQNVGGLAGRNAARDRYSGGIIENIVHVDNNIEPEDGIYVDRFIGYSTEDSVAWDNGGIGYLVVNSVDVDPVRIIREGTISISIELENIGDRSAEQNVFLTIGEENFDVNGYDEDELVNIPGGETRTLTFEHRVPSTTEIGDRGIQVQTDDDIYETDFEVIEIPNDNAELDSLVVNKGEDEILEDLTEEFNTINSEINGDNEKEYTIEEVHWDVEKVELIAELADENARINIEVEEEEISFDGGSLDVELEEPGETTTIMVEVLAENELQDAYQEDGNKRKMIIYIERDPNPTIPGVDANNSSVAVNLESNENSLKTLDEREHTFEIRLTGLLDFENKDDVSSGHSIKIDVYGEEFEKDFNFNDYEIDTDGNAIISFDKDIEAPKNSGEYDVTVTSVQLDDSGDDNINVEDIPREVVIDTMSVEQKILNVHGSIVNDTGIDVQVRVRINEINRSWSRVDVESNSTNSTFEIGGTLGEDEPLIDDATGIYTVYAEVPSDGVDSDDHVASDFMVKPVANVDDGNEYIKEVDENEIVIELNNEDVSGVDFIIEKND